jgi:DNA repair exonuclease SbcCD ATPase subunit
MSGMWLRRLEVKDLAGIASAVIDLKPGVNVLCGPNELGKSSLVRAIRAALLLPSAAAAADELRDWHVDAPPYVSLTIEESPGRVWRIQKRFGGGQDGSSLLEFSKNGNDFHLDARGREVDGKLHSFLQWGIPAPGGKGRRGSGLPDSFLVTVLLGDQNDVVGVLRRSLDDDADESAKSRLTAALQALAEDPRYKRVLEQVQERVDSAFTPAGRRKTARGSAWKQASDELRNAERLEAELREQLAESESAHIQVERLRADLQHAQVETDDARRYLERLRRDLERKRALVEHTQSRDVASREVERIQALRRLVEEKGLEVARATAHADDARQTLAARQGEKGEAEQRRDLALARVRELETGAAEQQRRLREQEAEKDYLRLTNEKSRLSRIEERAKEVEALVDAIKHDEAEIATLHASVSEKNELLQKAQESSESDAIELASLRQREVVARYRIAQDKATAAQKRRELGQDHRQQADLLESQAEEAKAKVARAALPSAEQIARLRDLDTQLKVAEGRASVSMVATLVPELNATVTVSLDGQQDTRVLEAGAAVELHFANELQATLPGFGRLKVRGEQADVLRGLQMVREALEREWRQIRTATKCQTLSELESLQEEASAWQAEASDLTRRASEFRIRGEGVEAAERETTLAEAEARHYLSQLESLLSQVGEHQTAEEYLQSLTSDVIDLHAVQGQIAELEAAIRERDDLRHALAAQVAGEDAELKALEASRLERETTKSAKESELDDPWEVALRQAASGLERLELQLRDVQRRLQAISQESSSEVGGARADLAAAEADVAQASKALDDSNRGEVEAKESVARLAGELEIHRRLAEAEDLDAATRILEQRTAALAALPAPENPDVDEDDLKVAEEDSAESRQRIRGLEDDLRRAEGALSQVGGDYVKDKADEARRAVEAAQERERALEIEYGAWQLLREVLVEAGRDDAQHLGKALVGPVSSRIAELTDGRYGEIAIGPQLDARGILLGGNERRFDQLSVGTQEQIALLVRLSIAEALKSFLVLDDHLTQTDNERMKWMRDLLEKASSATQVIVMTCHPERYQLTGGRTPTTTVDLEGVIKRSAVSRTIGHQSPSRGNQSTSDTVTLEAPTTTSPREVRQGRAGRLKPAGESVDLTEMLRRTLEKKK